MVKKASVFLTLAGILGPPVLVMIALSLSTDNWVEYDVDKKMLPGFYTNKTEVKWLRIVNSRDKGIFRECFPEDGIRFPQDTPGLTDDYCLETSYNVPDKDQSGYTREYWQRIHLMRTHLSFMVIGLICYLLAYVFGIVVCCARASKWALFSTVFTYGTAFSMALAMACFHGTEYLERNKIGPQPGDIIFQKNWPSEVAKATAKSYGYSYALGWVSMILSAIAGTLYAFAAWSLKGERFNDKIMLDSKSNLSTFSYPTYPMVPTIAEPVYNPYEDPRILYHYPEKQRPPSIAYEHGQDMWHWAN